MAAKIINSSEWQLTRAQAKLTYLGEQTGMVKTVVFSSEGFSPSMERFVEFQGPDDAYSNDNVPENILPFSVAPKEFRQLLQAVRAILSGEGVGDGPEFLSFCVVCETDLGTSGEEYRINYGHGGAFYEAIIGALFPANETGRKALQTQYRNAYPGE